MPPPEPNKKIDDLLKAYSRKRQEQAEPGFELHPMSRKLLLDEASRTSAEADQKKPSRLGSPGWWRWMAVAGVMVWVLFLCIYIEMPATKPADQSETQSLSAADVKLADKPAAKDVHLNDSMVTSRSATGGISPATAAPALVVAAAQPPAAVTPPAASVNSSDKLQQENAKEVASQTAAEDLKKNQTTGRVEAASAEQSAPRNLGVKQSADVATVASAGQAGGRGGQQFVQFNNRAQYRENVLSPPLPKVLTAFVMERSGDKVRVTDADGSVYVGAVLPPPGSRAALGGAASRAVAAAGQNAPAVPDNNYSFEVSGLNNNLNQNVVFTGHIVEEPAANQQSNQNQQSSQNIRCGGKVQVGTDSEFRLEAMPAP